MALVVKYQEIDGYPGKFELIIKNEHGWISTVPKDFEDPRPVGITLRKFAEGIASGSSVFEAADTDNGGLYLSFGGETRVLEFSFTRGMHGCTFKHTLSPEEEPQLIARLNEIADFIETQKSTKQDNE